MEIRDTLYYAGTKFPIYKVWWLREASQIRQTFIPLGLCEKVAQSAALQNSKRSSNFCCNWTSFHSKKSRQIKMHDAVCEITIVPQCTRENNKENKYILIVNKENRMALVQLSHLALCWRRGGGCYSQTSLTKACRVARDYTPMLRCYRPGKLASSPCDSDTDAASQVLLKMLINSLESKTNTLK